MVAILSPVAAHRREPPRSLARRLDRLEGARLGVIDNRRPNADIFLARLVALLEERFHPREVVVRRKPTVTEAAPFLAELADRCDAVVNAMVDHGACMAWSPGDTAALETRGIPVATVCSGDVVHLCRDELVALGLPAAPIIAATPTAEIPPAAVPPVADEVLADVVRALTTPAETLERGTPAADERSRESTETFQVEDRLDVVWQITRLFEARGWTDGLPIAPPTAERVQAMLAGWPEAPDAVVGIVPPRRGLATVEKIAVNAVMAGCEPAHLVVLVAALQAMLADEFNLSGIQTTTNPCGPLLILNGPIARKLGVNAGFGALGPGTTANATLGRAVRLMLLNLGGARPGEHDRATQGQPGKYSFCFAENEAASPWEPLHVERGFRPDESTVTVVGAEGPHNVNDHVHSDAHGILTVACAAMATLAGNHFAFTQGEPLLVLAPYHARRIAAGGFSKADVRRYLYEHARLPLARVERSGMWGLGAWPRSYPVGDPDALVPIAERWENLMVVVAGGAGKHSCWVPTFGMTRSVTRPVAVGNGTVAGEG